MERVKEKICYSVLGEGDVEETARCVTRVFTQLEPLTRHLNIQEKAFYPLAYSFCEDAAGQSLSHIARLEETGEIIGFRLSEDLLNPLSDKKVKAVQQLEAAAPIFSLLETLDTYYLSHRDVAKNDVLHWLLVGVAPEYRQKGVGKMLQDHNIQAARKAGYSRIICEATGPISQEIALQLDFDELTSIDYNKFTYQNHPPFAGIKGANCCKLMEKILKDE